MSKFIFLLTACLLLANAATAAEVALNGTEISALLNDSVLYGEENGQATDQIFQKNGVTYYHVGSGQSQGNWKVEGDQFCSQWSPNPAWACYDVTREDRHVFFISKWGERTDMLLAK